MSAPPGPPRRRAEVAYGRLRADLVASRWPPDTLLSAYALAEELDMSRSPVGEALKRLHAEGLVEIVPQVGCRVLRRSAEDVRELASILGALEGLAAERAAAHLGASRLRALTELVRRAGRAARAGDAAGAEAADRAFRDAVLVAADSPHLDRLITSVRTAASVDLGAARGPSALRAQFAGLKPVLTALAAADGPSARAALEAHVATRGDGNASRVRRAS